jgi:hypothetical protein
VVSNFIIYGLVDPFTKELRYIGKSCSGLIRPRNHFKPSELCHKTHKVHWIKSVLSQNKKPEIVIIEQHDNPELLDEAEQFWIEYYKSIGSRLTNSTNGGKGTLGLIQKDSTKVLMSEKRNEHYDKIREKNNGIVPARKKLHIFDRGLELKQCNDCEAWLELSYFHKCDNFWDDLQYRCKECDVKKRRSYVNYRRTTTDEQYLELSRQKCEKMNASLTTEKRSALVSKPIQAIHIETGKILTFPSGKSAELFGFKATRISTAINAKIPYKKYMWSKV